MDDWLTTTLVLNRLHPGCVRSGYCCKRVPCPFGKWDEKSEQCAFLEGDLPGGYACGIFDEIKDQPGAEVAPAFGSGCCSGMNDDRLEILKLLVSARKGSPPGEAELIDGRHES
jgi:hypothetical protein